MEKQVCFYKLLRDTEIKEHPNIALWVAFTAIQLTFYYIWKNGIEFPSGPHGKSEPSETLIIIHFSDARKEERVLEAAIP